MRLQILTLFTCLLLCACSNKDTPVYVQCYPLMPSPHRISEEILYAGPDTTYVKSTFFIYDGSGRLVFKLSSQGGIKDTIERYTYFSDKIIMNALDYTLNASGLAVSLSSFKTWMYNAEGYLTEETETYGGGTYASQVYYTCYNAEQIITRHQTSLGTFIDTTFYHHYSDMVNTIGNENHGILFLGRQDNTLIKSQIQNGQTLYVCTYVLDSMNRVLWETNTDQNGNLTYRKFQYL